jgi:hypothetical protein
VCDSEGQVKLTVDNFAHQGEKINEEYFRQASDIRDIVAFSHRAIAEDAGAI